MDACARKFTLQETRSSECSIVDAKGRCGFWPFRRAVSYHVGVNCDLISIRDGLLQVQRRGLTIATARLPGAPAPLARRLRAAWEALLHPRHTAKAASAQAAGDATAVRWEQLLQPRNPNKR